MDPIEDDLVSIDRQDILLITSYHYTFTYFLLYDMASVLLAENKPATNFQTCEDKTTTCIPIPIIPHNPSTLSCYIICCLHFHIYSYDYAKCISMNAEIWC